MATIAATAENRPTSRASAPAFIVVALASFLLVVWDPYRALLFSPILLGAPHALSDIWFLLVNDSDVPLKVRVAIAALAGVILSTALIGLLGMTVPPILDSVLLVALLAVPLALTANVEQSWPLWFLMLPLIALIIGFRTQTLSVVSHLHNVIALTFLLAIAAPRWRKFGVIGVAATVILVLAVGIGVSLATGSVFLTPATTKQWTLFKPLVFGTSGGLAGAILFSYALLQLLHFAVWIGFIPALKGERGIVQVFKGFGFGLPLLGAILLALTVAAAPLVAIHDPVKARQAYLTLVAFHGWMEIAWLLAHSARLMSANQFSFRKAFVFDAMQHA